MKTFEVIFIRMFYIVIDLIFAGKLLFIIVEDSSGNICKNILYTMKFIFIRKLYYIISYIIRLVI